MEVPIVSTRQHELWAHFRFGVVGSLLSAPPTRGTLADAINELCLRTWTHPVTKQPTKFSFPTIERWCQARWEQCLRARAKYLLKLEARKKRRLRRRPAVSGTGLECCLGMGSSQDVMDQGIGGTVDPFWNRSHRPHGACAAGVAEACRCGNSESEAGDDSARRARSW